jgi:hypothetical protein
MPWGLKRYQQTRDLHFITFSCYRRLPYLSGASAKHLVVGLARNSWALPNDSERSPTDFSSPWIERRTDGSSSMTKTVDASSAVTPEHQSLREV